MEKNKKMKNSVSNSLSGSFKKNANHLEASQRQILSTILKTSTLTRKENISNFLFLFYSILLYSTHFFRVDRIEKKK